MTSSGYRRYQHNPIALFHRRPHALQIFDIIFADEQIHKRAQFSAFVEQMRLDGGILSCQIIERVADVRSADCHFTFAAGVGAQRSWNSQCGHGLYILISFVDEYIVPQVALKQLLI